MSTAPATREIHLSLKLWTWVESECSPATPTTSLRSSSYIRLCARKVKDVKFHHFPSSSSSTPARRMRMISSVVRRAVFPPRGERWCFFIIKFKLLTAHIHTHSAHEQATTVRWQKYKHKKEKANRHRAQHTCEWYASKSLISSRCHHHRFTPSYSQSQTTTSAAVSYSIGG